MTEVNDEVQELQMERATAERAVALLESLERLQANKDFQEIFLQVYFKDEPSRLVMLKADKTQANPESQEDIYRQIDGIGQCHQYLQNIGILGRMSRNALVAIDETELEIAEEQGYE